MLLAAGLFAALFVFMERAFGRNSTLLLYPALFAVVFSLAARRLHDQGRSARWLAALIIPVLGPALLACLLLFRRGTHGDNPYGPDPITDGRDYLQVAAIEHD